jgi:diguanylate cyclase (GGDEF)-like protein
MQNTVTATIDRMLGIAGDSPRDIALIEQRLVTLQPRISWIYAMIVSCLVGLLITCRLERNPPALAVLLCVLASLRGAMWLKMRRQTYSGDLARSRLRILGIASTITALTAGILIVQAVPMMSVEEAELTFVMAATCAIALSAPLTPLPAAARANYIVIGLPSAAMGIVSGVGRALPVAAFNLFLCIIILLYLLRIQERAFVGRVDLRLKVESERTRAEQAERVAIEERTVARRMADTDFLTNLANRRAFLTALQTIAEPPAQSAVLILDLDGFKPVNDTFGHDVGDALLKLVADRLSALRLPRATVARLGGDEFALLVSVNSAAKALAIGRTIVSSLSEPYPIGDALVSVSASCGVALASGSGGDTSAVMRQADLALYRAKSGGRAAVELYSEGLGAETRRRAEIETALRAPGVEEEIELLYQPVVDLKTGAILSFEALARWTHSRLGAIAPSDFIPITEQMQLVEPISQALLRRAAVAALDWRDHQRLSFNLSAVQLCSFGSSARILRCLEEVGLPADRLQIEVTETAMMADFATARDNLAALQERGVTVMLDDFGAGYASLSYLREMRFDGIKLDGSLIAASQHAEGARLLKGVIGLAREVGVPCIAEHVETAAQAGFLESIDCKGGQGWWFSRPVTAELAAAMAHGGQQTPASRKVRQVA